MADTNEENISQNADDEERNVREIWNEGRVVGMSAYEIYLRHYLANQTPGEEYPAPASEREWLASSLAMGASLLLKLPTITSSQLDENGYYVLSISLPETSLLAGANTIVASYFNGEGDYESNGYWADRINSYGPLLANTQTNHPDSSTPSTIDTIEDNSNPSISSNLSTVIDYRKLRNYMKIVDGIIVHPGEWKDVSYPVLFPPACDLIPDIASRSCIRLLIRGTITFTHEPEILLTGFTLNAVLDGEVGTDGGSTNPDTNHWQNGGYLGPEVFPWASKIIFSVPNSYIQYFMNELNYTRKLPSSASTAVKVADTSVIDMEHTKPETYYSSHYQSAREQITVTDQYVKDDGKGTAVLTVYTKDQAYPPALYATFVGSKGTNYLCPIDIVAPGSVKLNTAANDSNLKSYAQNYPGTYITNGLNMYTSEDGSSPSATTPAKFTYTNPDNGKSNAINAVYGLSLYKNSTTQYTMSPTPSSKVSVQTNSVTTSSPAIRPYTWSMMLQALANDQEIDTLGASLNYFRSRLPNLVTPLKPAGSTVYRYLEMNNVADPDDPTNEVVGKRLYMCNDKVTTANDNDLGAGWSGYYPDSTDGFSYKYTASTPLVSERRIQTGQTNTYPQWRPYNMNHADYYTGDQGIRYRPDLSWEDSPMCAFGFTQFESEFEPYEFGYSTARTIFRMNGPVVMTVSNDRTSAELHVKATSAVYGGEHDYNYYKISPQWETSGGYRIPTVKLDSQGGSSGSQTGTLTYPQWRHFSKYLVLPKIYNPSNFPVTKSHTMSMSGQIYLTGSNKNEYCGTCTCKLSYDITYSNVIGGLNVSVPDVTLTLTATLDPDLVPSGNTNFGVNILYEYKCPKWKDIEINSNLLY